MILNQPPGRQTWEPRNQYHVCVRTEWPHLLTGVPHDCMYDLRRRWTAQSMPTHPLTASSRRVAIATELVLRELLPVARCHGLTRPEQRDRAAATRSLAKSAWPKNAQRHQRNMIAGGVVY